MIKDFRHVGVVVEDMETSLPFYRDLLGFEVYLDQVEGGPYIAALLGIPDARVRTVKMRAPGGQALELLHFQHAVRPRAVTPDTVGPTHIAVEVDDVARVYRHFREAGISFVSEPQRSPDGFATVSFCRAPEGTLVELVEISA